MPQVPWLPQNYLLPNEQQVYKLICSGEGWQLFETHCGGRVLFASPYMVKGWENYGILGQNIFMPLSFGGEDFYYLYSPKEYALAPTSRLAPPASKDEALAFSLALKKSRSVNSSAVFYNALYSELYSCLLPTELQNEDRDCSPVSKERACCPPVATLADEAILSAWLTNGVEIPLSAFGRLQSLIPWMSAQDLFDIIQAAGLELPRDAQDCIELERREQLSQNIQDSKLPQIKQKETVFSLPGRPQLEAFFHEHIIDIINHAAEYEALGIHFPSAVVLYGPPGCGKTFAVEKLVEFMGWPLYSINSSSIGSPYIHETGKKIAEIFSLAVANSPSIIVIDEMESFLSARTSTASSTHHLEEMAEFLRGIAEASKQSVLVIGMTNHIDMIDAAILRRGRFDHLIEVSMPCYEELESLLKSLLTNLPVSEEVDTTNFLHAIEGKSLADLSFLVREAARLTVKSGKKQIDQEIFDEVLRLFPVDRSSTSSSVGFI